MVTSKLLPWIHFIFVKKQSMPLFSFLHFVVVFSSTVWRSTLFRFPCGYVQKMISFPMASSNNILGMCRIQKITATKELLAVYVCFLKSWSSTGKNKATQCSCCSFGVSFLWLKHSGIAAMYQEARSHSWKKSEKSNIIGIDIAVQHPEVCVWIRIQSLTIKYEWMM